MAFQIRKARRSASKLRALLSGPSGSGKTWGALEIAKGIGGRTIVIDTEEGSSDLYDELHDFDVIDLRPPFSPERYIEAIGAAEEAGADVIVIDSVTHCWSGPGGCLEILEDVAKAQFRGNTWSAFSVITPRWRAFVDRILRSRCHVIATGRSKTETAQEDQGGRKVVKRLGMKLEARDGLEYEFTLCLDIIHDGHFAVATKDRTGIFTDRDPKPITVETGRVLAAWLQGSAGPVEDAAAPRATVGIEPAQAPPPADDPRDDERLAEIDRTVARAAIAIGKARTRGDADAIRRLIGERLDEGRLGNREAETLLRDLDDRESRIIAEDADALA
jgi:hypothetical protein